MEKFKIGSKVKCIKKEGGQDLVIGQAYTVRGYTCGGYVQFEEHDMNGKRHYNYELSKFEAVPLQEPRKHSELIKAWADGKSIQIQTTRCRTGHSNQTTDWDDEPKPTWDDWANYRIKPEPKPDVERDIYLTYDKIAGPTVGVKYSSPNVRAIFDAETGDLKDIRKL